MPVDKQVLLRYQVLNDCFRNPYREYDIDDLVDACSEAVYDGVEISFSRKIALNADKTKIVLA